ncbi:hypothetical protein BTJ40_09870 [Microbulbifer sp. A4B17]|uniref:DUF2059 domain-containing protein n=1 Tax=Microbulbifer sp. A4B17 TaxID=359370 RepID=UPI000D52EE23|nr:DUF2059 domain-containing protein [Microbulbifer sp. A4B17]AWF81096.1 hypothetical protein BTJ40_09870 [Microbulbifer sp. A4B17]
MKQLLLGVVLSVLSFGAIAGESKRESVEELLEVSNAEAMLDTIYAQMDQMLSGMSGQLGVRPSEQKLFDQHMKEVIALMKEEMNWQKIKEPMIEVYLKHYSEEEVQDMLTFFRTETGQSMLVKMPAVMNDSMVISQQMVQGFMPKLREISLAFKADLEEQRKSTSETAQN